MEIEENKDINKCKNISFQPGLTVHEDARKITPL